ncbi:helix-turn-helix domain-containing protein [Halovenus rubra]|uniref:Helix-turn-helix domain-containing protein n=2 Tax=Halovenus rubra TaxID=869890 RepID=A0ACC7E1H7_9EURY|nr:helix-turn-helix domain-containing protein [Halovenus rubra]
MQRVQATVDIDPGSAPKLYELLAHTDGVGPVRVLAVNSAHSDGETVLIAFEGDSERFVAAVGETAEVESIFSADGDAGRTLALLTTNPEKTQLSEMLHSIGSSGIVLRMPIIYRNGKMHTTAVGTAKALQQTHDGAQEDFPIHIESVGRFRGHSDEPLARLSDRQREALKVAHELGYYDQPRGGTHEDVATQLDCAPVTASEHLQKAESKVIDAVLEGDM